MGGKAAKVGTDQLGGFHSSPVTKGWRQQPWSMELAGSGSLLDLFRIRADKICCKIRHGCEKRRVKNGVEAFGLNI